MSEVSFSRPTQSENKTEDESKTTLLNNISGNDVKKEENKTASTPTKNEKTGGKRSSESAGSANDAVLDSNSNKNEKANAKRTPSKRLSFVERAQRESEELVKNLGGTLDIEGGRKTRSSTRGTPSRSNAVATPPPAKKSRATGAAATTATPRRGRGRKLDTTASDVIDSIAENEVTSSKGIHSVAGKQDDSKEEKLSRKSDDKIANMKPDTVENVQIEVNKNEDIEMNDISSSPKTPLSDSLCSNAKTDENKTVSTVVHSANISTTNALKVSLAKAASDEADATAVAVATENVDEVKSTAVAAKVHSDIDLTVESVKVADGKFGEITKNEDSKIEKPEKETICSSSGSSSNSNSNATKITNTANTTTAVAVATNISSKINENVIDSTDACGAAQNETAINSIPIKTPVVSPDATTLTEEKSVTVANEDEQKATSVVDVPSSLPDSPALASTVTPALVTESTIIVPPKSVSSSATTTAIEEKSEKSDSCEEPKLSSPQPPSISAASETVATPQYCN